MLKIINGGYSGGVHLFPFRTWISKTNKSLYPCDCDDGIDKELSSDYEDRYFDQGYYWNKNNNYNYSNEKKPFHKISFV